MPRRLEMHNDRVQDADLPPADDCEHVWRSVVPPKRTEPLFWLCEECEAVTRDNPRR